MKVIVAEDNRIDSSVMLSTLNKLNLNAISVASGLEAWKVLLAHPTFDLLITDYMMPDMNGADLVCSVRNHKILHEMPILIVSGFVKLSEVKKILDLGASRFQAKPIKTSEFVENICALLDLDKVVFDEDGSDQISSIHSF
jgi:CheY-like chemotaxis protein